MTYKLKQMPEDFIVTEVINPQIIRISEEEKIISHKDLLDTINTKRDSRKEKYAIFSLKKKNMTTPLAIELISNKLNVSTKDIGYCGNKDKDAVTIQYISVKEEFKKELENLSINNIELKFICNSKERLNLGTHEKNKFELVVRNLEKEFKINNILTIPNYFGEQRFSTKNIEIGKLLIKKEYKLACELIDDEMIKKHLEEENGKNENDFIGALKNMNQKILTLYVHSYQSFVFNELLKENIIKDEILSKSHFIIKEDFGELAFPKERSNNNSKKNELNFNIPSSLPLIGLDSDFQNPMIKRIIQKENITPRDFVNRQISCLSCEEVLRDSFVKLENLVINPIEKDELNPGKYKLLVSFILPKGSYATIAIRALFYH